jgi:hypothetical protein
MRFQDAARDARAVVYAGIQGDPLVARVAVALAEAPPEMLLMARAAMNGEREDPAVWRAMFPTLLGPGASEATRERAETVLGPALEIASKARAARDQYRGAIVEELTARLLGRRSTAVRRERRVLFDGIPAEIHPYDVTVETDGRPEVYDCKWGARGIVDDVLHQLDDARAHAADEDIAVPVALVVFDTARSCAVRLDRSYAPRQGTALVTLETIAALAVTAPPAGDPAVRDERAIGS